MTGEDEVVIQGDVTDDLIDFILEKFPQVIGQSELLSIYHIFRILTNPQNNELCVLRLFWLPSSIS